MEPEQRPQLEILMSLAARSKWDSRGGLATTYDSIDRGLRSSLISIQAADGPVVDRGSRSQARYTAP